MEIESHTVYTLGNSEMTGVSVMNLLYKNLIACNLLSTAIVTTCSDTCCMAQKFYMEFNFTASSRTIKLKLVNWMEIYRTTYIRIAMTSSTKLGFVEDLEEHR